MEYQTHNGVVEWGPDNIEPITDENREKIEQALKALIDALDRTNVTSIVISKIEDYGNQKNEEGQTE